VLCFDWVLGLPANRPVRFEAILRCEFERQLRRHSSLATRWVLPNHFGNQNSEILRESRSSTEPPAFPTPEKLECTSVPRDQDFRLYDHQSIPPVEPSSPEQQPESCRVGQALRPDVAFLVERQLFPEEQILSDQGNLWAEQTSTEPQGLLKETDGDREEAEDKQE
jgi:hypothetical protein